MDLLNCNSFSFDLSICALRLSKTAFGLGETVAPALFFLSVDDGDCEVIFSDFDPNPFTSLRFLLILSLLAFTESIISRILLSWIRVNPSVAAVLFNEMKRRNNRGIINLADMYIYTAQSERGVRE